MGNMTPPVGAAMYAGCTILDCSLQEYMKESLSFFIGTIATILILIFPGNYAVPAKSHVRKMRMT